MYTNGNFESHLAALLFLGMLGLLILLSAATVATFFWRRALVRYPMRGIAALLGSYGVLLAVFSYSSYDRTVARGEEKFFCALDCHIAYSVQNVERRKTIGDTTALGEFYVVTLRSHFDERTIAPWRGDRPLAPDPPALTLIDGNGRHYPDSANGQNAWEAAYGKPHTMLRSHFDERTIAPWRGDRPLAPDPPALILIDGNGRHYPDAANGQNAWEAAYGKPHTIGDGLRPGESYETTWVFDVPEGAQSVRMQAELRGFPMYVLIGDETSPGHGKTYLGLQRTGPGGFGR